MRLFLLPILLLFLHPYGFAQETVSDRITRIDSLLKLLNQEVGELKKNLGQQSKTQRIAVEEKNADTNFTEEPLATELLSKRQKKTMAAAYTPSRRMAFGFSTNKILPFSLHFLHWEEKWGYSIEAAGIYLEDSRFYGVQALGLRSIHAFSLGRSLLFKLYGLGGLSLNGSKESYWTYDTGSFQGSYYLYSKPDTRFEMKGGFGVDISVPFVGGVRIAPEIGYSGGYFLTRHQDSGDWPALNPGAEKPASDFYLEAYLGMKFNFYFK